MRINRSEDGAIRCLAYSPNGSSLALGSEQGFLVLWDLTQGKERLARQDYRTAIRCLAYAPDGQSLVTGGPGGRVVLRTSADGRIIGGHSPPPDGGSLHDQTVNGLAFAPGGRFVVSVSGDTAQPGLRNRSAGVGVIWDTTTDRYLALISAGAIWSMSCDLLGNAMAFGTETHLLITPGLHGEAFADWDTTAEPYLNQVLIQFNLRDNSRLALKCPARTRTLTFAPDSLTLASSSGRNVDLWDPIKGVSRTSRSGHDAWVSALAFSPDGRTLASSSLDGSVRLWDAEAGQERASFDWEIGPVHCLAFSPDGMTMAAGGDSGLAVWDSDRDS